MVEKDVKLSLELTLAETNVVLGSLSKESYSTVAGLIAKIQQQAQAQLDSLQNQTQSLTEKE